MIRLLQEGEDLHAFMKLPPDQILLRWFNYHLARAGWHRRVTNFSSDIQVWITVADSTLTSAGL